MQQLEAGSIANADEQRQVGHYWLRSQLAPSAPVGDHVGQEIDQIEQFGQDVLSGVLKAPCGEPFTDVLWIGIGGSGLGPMLMVRALQSPAAGLLSISSTTSIPMA